MMLFRNFQRILTFKFAQILLKTDINPKAVKFNDLFHQEPYFSPKAKA